MRLGILRACLSLCAAAAAAQSAELPALAGPGDLVAEPEAAVEKVPGAGSRGLLRFKADLNNDDEPDLFLALKGQQKRDGTGPVHIFVREKKSWRYAGLVELQIEALQILQGTRNGLRNLKTYLPYDKDTGEIAVYGFTGLHYVRVKTIKKLSRKEAGRLMHRSEIQVEELGGTGSKP